MTDTTTEISNITNLPEDPAAWEIMKPYSFQGLGIVIEYRAGDTRTKVKGTGIIISGVMPTAYGFILRTTDQHGEEIDMYLSSTPQGDAAVYVIDQVCSSSGMFDEHKVMLGFASAQDATDTYLKAFADGSGKRRLGAITAFPGETFKTWTASEGYNLQPASKYKADGVTSQMLAGIAAPRIVNFPPPKAIDEAGGVIISLPDLSKGPRLETSIGEGGRIEYTLNVFSGIDTEVWSNVVDTFCRTLDRATEDDVVRVRISSGGGCVFTMGRVCSAIKTTKAKVITYAQGSVASAATTIWAAGHERHILPGAYFMQHMSSQLLGGKTTDIQAKAGFCVEYIRGQLQPLIEIGLFTPKEVNDMVDKSADIFVSGREAAARIAARNAETAQEA